MTAISTSTSPKPATQHHAQASFGQPAAADSVKLAAETRQPADAMRMSGETKLTKTRHDPGKSPAAGLGKQDGPERKLLAEQQAPVSGIVPGTPIVLPGVPQAMPGKWASKEIVRGTALGGKVVFHGTKAQVDRMMRTFNQIYAKSPTFRAQMDANIKANGPMNFVAGKLTQDQVGFVAGAKAPYKNAIIFDETMFSAPEKQFIELMVHECGHILTGYGDPSGIDPKTGKWFSCGAIGGNEEWIAQIMYEMGLNPKRVIKPYCDGRETGPNHRRMPPKLDGTEGNKGSKGPAYDGL